MINYADKLRADLAEQFKDKPVIDALFEAIGEQLTEVFCFFDALQNGRSFQTATGSQLDGIGDIVGLSRKDASTLFSEGNDLSDEEYRKYLMYKVWQNTCDCTYYDTMRSLRLFWDKTLYYKESPDVPATIMFETEELQPSLNRAEDDAAKILSAPFVKAAGVSVKVTAITAPPEVAAVIPFGSFLFGCISSTPLPEIQLEMED